MNAGKANSVNAGGANSVNDDGVYDEVYDGPAVLICGDARHPVRVRLTGHIDPIDGKYHWQGTVFEAPQVAGQVRLAVDGRSAPARITEQTPWGSYSIAGVGAPPFELVQPT